MTLTALLLAVLFQAPATLPDFSGEWKMVPARSGSAVQDVPITDMTFVIQHQADQVAVESRSGSDKPIATTYQIGEAPKQPAEPMAAGATRAYWDGRRLVVERGGVINGQTVSMRQAFTMDPERGEMIVERLVVVQHGYTLKGTANYATVKDIFVRVAR